MFDLKVRLLFRQPFGPLPLPLALRGLLTDACRPADVMQVMRVTYGC